MIFETLHSPATKCTKPAVIGWFACALACAVCGGTWVALRGRHNSYAANLPITIEYIPLPD